VEARFAVAIRVILLKVRPDMLPNEKTIQNEYRVRAAGVFKLCPARRSTRWRALSLTSVTGREYHSFIRYLNKEVNFYVEESLVGFNLRYGLGWLNDACNDADKGLGAIGNQQ
jgi:hypothetical protein